jgi:hypothetical protein
MSWNESWEKGNPEEIVARNEEKAASFEDRWGDVTTGRVAEILKDSPELEKELMHKNFPFDYDSCNEIGEKHGLGAEEVAAVSFTIKGGRKGEAN